jgi:membrane peptidoglycan carboxypeptidase
MTLVDAAPPPRDARSASPARRGGPRWIVGILAALILLASAAVIGATYFYDGVPSTAPLPVSHPVVPVAELPPPVSNAFVAAVDPDFYGSRSITVVPSSLITRRYMVIAADTAGADAESSWRTRVMAHKFEAEYTQTDILGFYLNSADFGSGAVGLAAAAQTYFRKPATQLTVAEAALLAVRLDPDRPDPRTGWEKTLDTMVERGWLSSAERTRLTFPG